MHIARLGIRKADVDVRLAGARWARDICVAYHYLHRPRVGVAIPYEVLYRNQSEGLILYSMPMVCRPMFGYQPGEILELSRCWFKTNPANLGSCAIRKTLKRLPKDSPGVRAVVSWCDRTKFDGALYKACGFRLMGQSRIRGIEPSGRGGGRPDRNVQKDRLHPKDIYLIELGTDATQECPPDAQEGT